MIDGLELLGEYISLKKMEGEQYQYFQISTATNLFSLRVMDVEQKTAFRLIENGTLGIFATCHAKKNCNDISRRKKPIMPMQSVQNK